MGAAKRTLKVYYDAEEIDEMLDKAITEFLSHQGYSFYASGYNLEEKVRDLAFEEK